MKKLFAAIALFYLSDSYCYSHEVVEMYNSDPTCCYVPQSFWSGFYLEANIGYSWFSYFLARPAGDDELFPLLNGEIKENGTTAGAAIGYDIYSRNRIPLRLEYNFLYANESYIINPLFPANLSPPSSAADSFTVYNHMVTAYVDWHNCTRFIPFLGASLGWVEIDTTHRPSGNQTFDGTMHNTSWGGTIGTRFMFNDHLLANLQLRYNDLGTIEFKNTAFLFSPLAGQNDYLSHFMHETTLWVGLAYQF